MPMREHAAGDHAGLALDPRAEEDRGQAIVGDEDSIVIPLIDGGTSPP